MRVSCVFLAGSLSGVDMHNLKHCQKSVPRDHIAKMDSDRTVRRTGSLSSVVVQTLKHHHGVASSVHRTVHKAGSLSRDVVGNADERAAALRNEALAEVRSSYSA